MGGYNSIALTSLGTPDQHTVTERASASVFCPLALKYREWILSFCKCRELNLIILRFREAEIIWACLGP